MKKYDKYKDSGIEWIGDIPEKWDVRKLKSISKINMGQSPGGDSINNKGEGLPFLQGKAEFGDTYPVTEYWTNNPTKIANTNDILLSVRAPVGDINIANEKYCIGRGLAALTHKNFVFLYYLLYNAKKEIIKFETGSTFKAISMGKLKNVKIPHTIDFFEQNNISNYLSKTSNIINKVIENKKRQIKLLNEKKKILVKNAVTKSINKNTQLIESNVDWFGGIPKEWSVKRIKDIFKVVTGSTPKSSIQTYWDGDIKWITPTDLNEQNQIVFDSERKITEEGYENCGTEMIRKGSLIMATRAPIGYITLTGIDLCFNQGCKALVSKSKNNKYYFYLLKSFEEVLKEKGRGTTFIELPTKELAQFRLLCPPKEEQKQIVNFLDNYSTTLSNLAKTIQDEISRLKEYKEILIHDVVTGKMKVTA